MRQKKLRGWLRCQYLYLYATADAFENRLSDSGNPL